MFFIGAGPGVIHPDLLLTGFLAGLLVKNF